jgi:hypothetical protein
MNRLITFAKFILPTLAIVLIASLSVAQTSQEPLDLSQIETASGTKATLSDDGVVRISWARTDVAVTVDGSAFEAAAGLGSWAAFIPAPQGAMVMGDTVVFEDEVDIAMDAALAGGLEITSLHHHFFFDTPKPYFMHIGGQGDPLVLATGVKAMWDSIKRLRSANPNPASGFGGQGLTKGTIDAARIEQIAGYKASVKAGGVVKVTIGREAKMNNVSFGGSMGLTTWAAFSGSDDQASVGGDIAMTASEVQPVLRALRNADFHVVALHNHMITDDPAYIFVHYWAKGSAEDLAKGFRAVLDAQADIQDVSK